MRNEKWRLRYANRNAEPKLKDSERMINYYESNRDIVESPIEREWKTVNKNRKFRSTKHNTSENVNEKYIEINNDDEIPTNTNYKLPPPNRMNKENNNVSLNVIESAVVNKSHNVIRTRERNTTDKIDVKKANIQK